MGSYEFVTVNVFTQGRSGGNPLAVVLDARGLSEARMQAIAADFNLSETTFVLPPEDPRHHARVRIFTPRSEMPFAGHPNVGTGFVLAGRTGQVPEHYVFEEVAGLVRVHLLLDTTGKVSGARVSAPHSLSLDVAVPTELVAACVGLREDDFETVAHTPIVASVGTPFVLAEMRSLAALARARPDPAAFQQAAAAFPTLGDDFKVHLYARKDGDVTRLRCRMFAPLIGVPEDPATGSANAALAALLTSLAPGDNVSLHYEIEQGVEMGQACMIIAGAQKTGEGPVLATVSGTCVETGRGTLEA